MILDASSVILFNCHYFFVDWGIFYCGRIWDLLIGIHVKKNLQVLLYNTISAEGSQSFWGKWAENNGFLLAVIMIIVYCYSSGAKSLPNGKQNEMWIYVDVITSSEYQVRQEELGENLKGSFYYLCQSYSWSDRRGILGTQMSVHILQQIINKKLYL